MINGTFRRYLEEAIGHENALVAFSAFERPASVSVRLNPFKPSQTFDGRKVLWSPYGRMLAERPVFTLDPVFHGGAYYVQDSSSMFVGHVFRKMLEPMKADGKRRVRVLDLCAAPGGKTTDLVASLRERYGDNFILVSNEVMKARVGVLADNVALWGDPNVVVTSDDPRSFAALGGYFDVIVADVPCSGEGMFRKDEEAQKQWSEDNVALCEARQRRIVADVWPALAEGGLFVYSTCTFNTRENDGNVRWIAEELGAEYLTLDRAEEVLPGVLKTDLGYSLVPGLVEGEGQYCAALRKTGIKEGYARSRSVSSGKRSAGKVKNEIPAYIQDYFAVNVTLSLRGDKIIAVPESLTEDIGLISSCLHVISSGCAAGMVKGKDFIPDADMALSLMLAPHTWKTADVDKDKALAFLHKDQIVLPDLDRGYILIRYDGVNLGFVKNIGSRCNNLHPQSRRIRMNIK